MSTAALHHLDIDVSQFGVAGQHLAAIEANSARGWPTFAPAIVAHDGTMVVVGSGPSLPTVIEEIRGEREKGRPLCAVNGAHDLLCESGMDPDLFLTVDPRDLRHNLTRKNANTVYLLASRCAPEVFDHLTDCKGMLWHSYGHPDEMETVKRLTRIAIGGGSTSGLRAIALCYMMGFRHFLLYGFDSCLDAQGRKRFYGGTVGRTIDVVHRGQTFTCNYAMAAQAREFEKATYGMFADIHLEARGGGLIASILAGRKADGKRV